MRTGRRKHGKATISGRGGLSRMVLTHLDGHSGAMESKREQSPLSKHALVSSSELDLGDGESVTEVETSIGVRVRNHAEELRVLLSELIR